ncbi:MAG: hypothetical protein COV76_07725 [Candidatus Omnitrophica bacterium CG11_big_fil_rev_8_21_14_0_20_64_10]|nr:MAG: hypothetical protein COV76_07725 [Candidatus Omnitrophica bacterium CG11_big_fil_rev_8_21_14_0_20_64_10]
MSLAPEEVIARAKAWLAASERITEFPAGPGISVDPARQVGSWLHEGRTHRASFGIGEDYRTRVAELALDRVLSEPLTPPVEVAPHALPDAEVNRLLPHAKTFAVVTGKRALLNHHLYPWGMSAAGSDVNVVAVHEDWLTEDGRASRLMLLDPATGRPVEFVPNRPVVITHAFITELPADRETAAHRALDDRLSGSGVHLLNPAIHSNVRADDKTWLRTHATDGVTVPFSRTVPANSASDAALSRVQAVAGWAYDGLVVQPAADTTEAEGVRWFPGEEGQAAADYAAELSGSGPVLISTYHGNVTYQGRPVVFRFNVAAGRVASASAVVAAPGSRIANAGAGGEILPLDQVLAGLTGPNGQPIGMTAAAWRRLANQAEEAALAVGLGVAGVDLVMDTDPEEAPGEVQGVTLEINARPGLLIFGEQATFSEMGIHFRPAGSATAGFWNQLPPVSPELLERSHRPVIRQVMIVSRDLGGVERLRKMIRRDHPWVDILVFDDIESASGQFRKMRVGVVAPVGAVFWLSYSFAEDENAQADFFEEEGQMFPIHILGASAFRPEALEKTLQMVNRYLNQVGVRETLTLAQWREAVRFPDRSGLRAAVARQVPADEVDEELERIRDLVEQAAVRTVEVDGAEELLFDPDQPLALSFAPGRVRFFMGHTDIRGLGGQTINAATHYGAWALTQMDHYDPESRVVADNLDPQHPAFQFRLGDPDVLPPAGVSSIRPDWLAWAEAHGDPYKWQGNTRGLFAFMRTAYLDPEGHRRAFFENKGFRILVSESTLPPGQGLASSSALPGLLARGVQPFLPPEARLNAQQLNDMDYVAYVSGDRAGTADMTAINMGQLGQVSVLYSFPEAQGETVTLPDDFRLFVVNSTATPRLDDVNQTPENRDLARFIKSMTGMGPALAAVWLRHISRTRPAYGPLERLLMTDPAGAPFGLLRELTSIGNLADPQYVEMVGAETPEARAAFVERVLSEIPNDLTVEQILEQVEAGDLRQLVRDLLAGFSPMGASRLNAEQAEELEALKLQSVIPLRQMAAYGVREIERGVAYVAAAKAGRARELIRLMRRAHDGDRAVWEMNSGGQLEMTPWGKTEPEEAFFRSITVADAVVDAFQSAMDKQFGENAGAARTMAAGLGLGLAVGVTAEAYPAAKAFWKERGFDIIEVQPGGGATSVQLNLSAPVSNQAGLEAAVPVSFAGFRKAAGGYVVVPASVQTEQPVLIVTPEPAAIAKLTAAVTLTTASGLEAPRIEVLARDGVHAARLRDGLEAVGLRGFRVHDAAAAYGGNVGAAAEAIQFEHWRAGRATELVTAASGLESVVRFLGAVLPEAAAHALQAVIDRNQELFA